ncbi:hypothetical protein MP228_001057 [Amoeboaphelidium protococcarum]|nr:hypothetical protein MP228_001057 [Amoeboaphelidium protococcarum]
MQHKLQSLYIVVVNLLGLLSYGLPQSGTSVGNSIGSVRVDPGSHLELKIGNSENSGTSYTFTGNETASQSSGPQQALAQGSQNPLPPRPPVPAAPSSIFVPGGGDAGGKSNGVQNVTAGNNSTVTNHIGNSDQTNQNVQNTVLPPAQAPPVHKSGSNITMPNIMNNTGCVDTTLNAQTYNNDTQVKSTEYSVGNTTTGDSANITNNVGTTTTHNANNITEHNVFYQNISGNARDMASFIDPQYQQSLIREFLSALTGVSGSVSSLVIRFGSPVGNSYAEQTSAGSLQYSTAYVYGILYAQILALLVLI